MKGGRGVRGEGQVRGIRSNPDPRFNYCTASGTISCHFNLLPLTENKVGRVHKCKGGYRADIFMVAIFQLPSSHQIIQFMRNEVTGKMIFFANFSFFTDSNMSN